MKLLTDRVCWCSFLTLPKLTPLIQHLLLFLAFLFLLLGFCQNNNNHKKLTSNSHCNKFHSMPLKVPPVYSMHTRTNFDSSFWTRKGKTRGKEEKKKKKRHRVAREGGKGGARPVWNPSYLSSWPCLACKALSQELALKIRKRQAAPGETGSWLSGELEEISAHPPHTHTLPFASFLFNC